MVNFKKTILASVVAASMLATSAISSSAATIYSKNFGNSDSSGSSEGWTSGRTESKSAGSNSGESTGMSLNGSRADSSGTSESSGSSGSSSSGTSSSESGTSSSGKNEASDSKSVGSANIYAINDGTIEGNGSFGKPYSTKDGELRITTDVGDTPTSTSTKYVNGKKVTVKVYEGTEKSGSFYAEENGELSLIKLVPGDAYKDRVSNGSAA